MKSAGIIVVRLSSLGDIVHSAHAASGITAATGRKIAWLTSPQYEPLVRRFEFVEEILLADTAGPLRALRSLAALRRHAGRFNTVIDLQGLIKSALPARMLGRVAGFMRPDAREGAWLLYRKTVRAEETHATEKQARLVSSALGTEITPQPLPGIRAQRKDGGYTVFIAAASRGNKAWPMERFLELADILSGDIYVCGGPDEQETVRHIAGHPRVEAAPPMDLPALVDFLSAARLVIGVDTGPVHLASALGVPVVALFGPTDPARTRPYGPGARIVLSQNECRLCLKRRCLLGEHPAPCMSAISAAEVARAAHTAGASS